MPEIAVFSYFRDIFSAYLIVSLQKKVLNGNAQNLASFDFQKNDSLNPEQPKTGIKRVSFIFSSYNWQIFMIFCTMMQNGNAQNVTEPDFRKKKFGANLGQKLPKNRVFWTLYKIGSLIFSDFLHNDTK